MTIHLSKELSQFIHDAVRAGVYANEDDVIRDALTRLKQALLKSAPTSGNNSKRAAPATADAKETAYEIASRAGLIGCLKSARGSPTDLSTNPEHMKGFGRE